MLEKLLNQRFPFISLLIAVFALIFSRYAMASDIDLEGPLRPACSQHCKNIDSIPVFYTSKINELYVEYLEEKIKSVIARYNQQERIKVISIKRPVEKNWYQFLDDKVTVQFYVKEYDEYDNLLLGSIRMIAPSGAYNENFVCDISGKKEKSCIESNLDEFVLKIIDNFLFHESIAP